MLHELILEADASDLLGPSLLWHRKRILIFLVINHVLVSVRETDEFLDHMRMRLLPLGRCSRQRSFNRSVQGLLGCIVSFARQGAIESACLKLKQLFLQGVK
jgi:hypothetical protein